MDSENRDLRKPVTLAVAAEVLAERYPEYAFTARQLRQFVQMGKLPYLPIEREYLAVEPVGMEVPELVLSPDGTRLLYVKAELLKKGE